MMDLLWGCDACFVYKSYIKMSIYLCVYTVLDFDDGSILGFDELFPHFQFTSYVWFTDEYNLPIVEVSVL